MAPRRRKFRTASISGYLSAALLLFSCSHASRVPASDIVYSAATLCKPSRIETLNAATAAQSKYTDLLQSNSGGIDDAIYTWNRRQKVEELFYFSRDQLAKFLTALAKKTPNPLFTEMTARVQAALPITSTRPAPDKQPEYGARVVERAAPDQPDHLLVGGSALLVDSAPEALRLMFLHELSHLIDPRAYPVPLDAPGASPFAKAVQCLRSPVSVSARAGGAECVANKAPNWPSQAQRDFCSAEAGGLQSNPDFSTSGPDCGCPVPQGSEAFADWLAAEELANLVSSPGGVLRAMAWPCSMYLAETARDSALDPSLVEQLHAADPHPPMSDRIEKIFLVQPQLRSWLGGETTPGAAVYCPLTEPKTPQKPSGT